MALVAVVSALGLGCSCDAVAVPDDTVAVIHGNVVSAEDIAVLRHQLGAYAQRRFSGQEGTRQLLDAVVDAKLLEHAAMEAGLADDARVEWSVLEEEAALYLNAQLERSVPEEPAARDHKALRAYYHAHRDDFMTQEKRSAQGVLVDSFQAADEALGRLRTGSAELAELGPIISTPMRARDDREFPGFHRMLFDPNLRVGDWLPSAVPTANGLMIARLLAIEPATLEDFDDPAVRERLVAAVRAPLLEKARATLLEALARRYPVHAG